MKQAQEKLMDIWNLICENESSFIKACFGEYRNQPRHILDISLGMANITCKCDWAFESSYDQIPLKVVLEWADKTAKENK